MAKAVPAAPAASVPGTVRDTSPSGDSAAQGASEEMGSDSPARGARARRAPGALVDDTQAATAMAKAAPAAPPVSVPGTVRNTSPIGVGDAPEAIAMMDDTGANDSGLPARPPRARRARGALMEDGMPQDMAAVPGGGDSELKPSPTPPAIPAPPIAARNRNDEAMDVPPPVRPQGGAIAAAPTAPTAPPAAVPGTVRNTAPQGDSAAPQGNVQMPKAKPGTVPAPENEKISLSADVLFKFDKYREKDILPGGREKLDDVADKINSYIKDTLESIKLTGHTDRLGSDAYNQRLSERRSKTVKNYLVKKGVDASKLTNSGRGEREPVVQCQGNKPTKKLIACLQPNRRVDVEIHGVKHK